MWRFSSCLVLLPFATGQDFKAKPMLTVSVEGYGDFYQYVDMECSGKSYTSDAKKKSDAPGKCNGWGDITEKECLKKCIESAHPEHCSSGHECYAAVFYPKKMPSKMHTKGWCHLFEESQCKKFSYAVGTPNTFAKISMRPKREDKSDKRRLAAASGCEADAECSGGRVCIGWSYLSKKYSGKCGEPGSAADLAICSRNMECASGHCIAGYCLAAGKECKDGENWYGCDYDIDIEKDAVHKLGVDIIYPSMAVSGLQPGLIQMWNQKHPSRAVKIGDRIVSVNGVMFWDKAVLTTIKEEKNLKIKLMGGHMTKEKKQGKWTVQSATWSADSASPAAMASMLLAMLTLTASAVVLMLRRSGAAEGGDAGDAPTEEEAFLHVEEI